MLKSLSFNAVASNTKDSHLEEKAQWFIFSGSELLVNQTQSIPFMSWSELCFLHHYHDKVHELIDEKESNDERYFVVDLGAEKLEQDGWQRVSLRSLITDCSALEFERFAKAWQYTHFLRTHQFCGRCGSRTKAVDWEMAMHCYSCGHRCYPRVSPCIIVAIYYQDKLLLAQGVNHRENRLYSTIAGFVESGEDLESAVHREVFEEVGVKIKNLEYFGSQPWPFPHSLMVGYIAEWDSGEIRIQEKEIDDAQWFQVDNLPNIPSNVSIAGKLITTVIERIKNQT